eukprot:gene9629-12203_t
MLFGFLYFVFNFNREKTHKQTALKSAVSAVTQWLSVFEPSEDCAVDSSPLVEFGQLMSGVRTIVFHLLLFILFVLMPAYIALSHYYDTYSYEYAWSVTAAYLS